MSSKINKKKLQSAINAHKKYIVYFSDAIADMDDESRDKITERLYSIESENSVLIEYPALS